MRVKRSDKVLLFSSDKQLKLHLSERYKVVPPESNRLPLFIILDAVSRYQHLDVFSLLTYMFGYLYFKLGEYARHKQHCYLVVLMKPRVLKVSLLEKRLVNPLSRLFKTKRFIRQTSVQSVRSLSQLISHLGDYYNDKGSYKVAIYRIGGFHER